MFNIVSLRNLIYSFSPAPSAARTLRPSLQVVVPKSSTEHIQVKALTEITVREEKIQIVQETVQTALALKQEDFCKISHPDPYKAIETQKAVTEVFSYRNSQGALISRGAHRGFHGTTLEKLKMYVNIEQIYSKEMAPIGKRIYFNSLSTATEYALRANYRDFFDQRTLGTECTSSQGPCLLISQPVILAISSDEAPGKNNLKDDPELHPHFHYFSGKNRVFIDGMWLLNPTLRELDGSAASIRSVVGIGIPERLIAAASRSIPGGNITFY